MPLNTLLLSDCLLPGKTSYEEGVKIKLKPESGETVLFFNIDNQSNPNCKLRQLLGLNSEGQKICDLIVFYAKEDTKIICFVELKGSDIKTARDQVINTYTAFNKFLRKYNSGLYFTPKIYILFNGSVPKEIDKYQEELKNMFGEGNSDINRNPDLGAFLRGAGYQSKAKRKKGK